MIGLDLTLLHPGGDIAPSVDLPFMDMRYVAELLQLLADPESPIPIAAGIADEDIGHGATLLRQSKIQTQQLLAL